MGTGDVFITMTPLQYAEYQHMSREIARLRAVLALYADPANWQVRDYDGEMREWIGEGEGLDLAEKALEGGHE